MSTAHLVASATASFPVALSSCKAQRYLSSSALGTPRKLLFPSLQGSLSRKGASRSIRQSGRTSITGEMTGGSWLTALFGSSSSKMAQTSKDSEIALGPDTDTPGAGLQFFTFGAGCFWGPELAFQRVAGVVKTEVGYTQGTLHNPSYEDVCTGRTGHNEAVRVEYDPKEVSYEALLSAFWSRVDPTAVNRQGNDVGTQYRSGIYYYNEEQEKAARASLEAVQAKVGKKVATEILPARKFYRAESYHQQYLARGGRFGMKQSPAKGCADPIRCYG